MLGNNDIIYSAIACDSHLQVLVLSSRTFLLMIYVKSIVGYKLWAMYASVDYSLKFGIWNSLVYAKTR